MKATIQKLYKAINRRLLIQLTFPSLLLLCSFKPGENIGMLKSPVVRKEFKVDNAFKSILLEGNISLVLTNDPAGTVIIEGKKKELNKINPVFKNNILVIDANQKNIFAKITINLSALAVETIQLNGDGYISSIDFIQSDHLHMSLNGNIRVKVRTLGKISFDAPDDIELLMKPPVIVKKK